MNNPVTGDPQTPARAQGHAGEHPRLPTSDRRRARMPAQPVPAGFPRRVDRPVRSPDTRGHGRGRVGAAPGDRAGAWGRLVRTAQGTWFEPPLAVALILVHPRPVSPPSRSPAPISPVSHSAMRWTATSKAGPPLTASGP